MNTRVFRFIFVFGAIFFQISVHADPEISLKLKSLGQIQEDKNGDTKFPFSQYGYLYISDPKLSSEFSTDFRYAKDLSGDDNRFDLYQAVFHINQFENYLDLQGGRFQVADGIDYFLVDGLKASGALTKNSNWSLYGGWTHDTEWLTSRDSGKLVGGHFGYASLFGFRNQISFLIEDYKTGAKDQRISLALGHGFSPLHLSVDSGLEYSIKGNRISHAFLTNDYFITKVLSGDISYFFRNPLIDNTQERDPIFANFSVSGVHSVRTGFSIHVKNWISLNPSYELSTYRATDADRKITHQNNLAVYLLSNPLKLRSRISYSYWKSYGGNSHLISYVGGYELTPRMDINLGGELAFYKKITNESAKASRAYVESNFKVTKRINFATNFELISNEDKERDVRVMFLLEMMLGTEI